MQSWVASSAYNLHVSKVGNKVSVDSEVKVSTEQNINNKTPAPWQLMKKHLTQSLAGTVRHSHLLPQGVDRYEINGSHTWVDPHVSAHVDELARLLACR